MDRLRELLQNLANLTDDELTELHGLIISESAGLEGETPDVVAQLNELADGLDNVNAERTARETAAAENTAAAAAARDRIKAASGTDDTDAAGEEEDPKAETDTDDEDDPAKPKKTPAATGETETDPAAQVPALTAAGGRIAALARHGRVRGGVSLEHVPPQNRATLVASGGLRGLEAGTVITDRETLAIGMSNTLNRMNRRGAPRGDVIIASAVWEYPDDRTLGNDQEENRRKMEAVIRPEALLASGGICAPVNVDYNVGVWATDDRPVKEGLPSFDASRGGLTYVTPPSLASLAGATGLWTEATDANPDGATKPVLAVQCGSQQTVYVEAVTTRLQFGNMMSRFAPEQVAANTELAIDYAARFADNNLLNLIAAVCVAGITTATTLGATRDLLMAIDQTLAGYRNNYRIPRSQAITVIFPDWVKDLIRVDLSRELAHDNSGEWNVLQLTDAQIEGLLKSRGINPIFHIDGQTSSVSGGVAQTFLAPATGAIKPFPTKMVWYLWPEGQIQFLDGGRLDLGVVRDSTLDATNDYETFVETFEAITFRGFSGGALQLVSTLCANGQSAATVSTTGVCA